MTDKLVPRLRFPEFRGSGEWEGKKLGDVCEVVGGGTPDTDIKEYWGGDILWYTPTEIKSKKYVNSSNRKITELGLKNSSAKLLPINTILITSRATIGDMAILTEPATTNQGFQSLIVNNTDSIEYIYYLQHIIKKELFRLASGSTFLEVNKNRIQTIEIPLPCLKEQQKIADCLSSLDELITAQTEKTKALKQHKKALMQNLFPKAGKTVPKLRFPEFKNSGKWENSTLGEVCEINPKSQDLPDEFVYIDLESVANGLLLQKNNIKKINAPSRAQRKIQSNDILYQMVRPYQKNNYYCTESDINSVASTGYAQLRCTSNSSKYIYQSLHHDDFVNNVMVRSTGTSYPAINSSDLSEIGIAIPTRSEQQKIADCLSSLDELITAQTEKTKALKQHKKALMQSLFPNNEVIL